MICDIFLSFFCSKVPDTVGNTFSRFFQKPCFACWQLGSITIFLVLKQLFVGSVLLKSKKYFFEKNVLGSYGDIKVYHFHVFSTFFQKSWSFCDFDPTYHWLRHFHFCFLAKFTQQTAVVKAFSTISVITLCSSRRVRWQLMGPIRNFWPAKKIGVHGL